MDPSTTLSEIRGYLHRSNRFIDPDPNDLTEAEIVDMQITLLALAGKIESLDKWLSKGGFLPHAWNVNRK